MLTLFQNFSTANIVPNLYAVAVTAVVPSVLSQTQSVLSQYGLFGDLVHVGAVGSVFAAFVYVSHDQTKMTRMLTMIPELPRSVHISWTATGGSAAANDMIIEAYADLAMKVMCLFARCLFAKYYPLSSMQSLVKLSQRGLHFCIHNIVARALSNHRR